MNREDFRQRYPHIPTKPGVYLMRDARGKVIYVGKAVNLRNRVRSYFHASSQDYTGKIHRLVHEIAEIEFIVTDSELEALILECNLIKKHRPRFNVRLKDDKRYPYIKISWQDDYPSVFITRRMVHDGGKYYGPYTSVSAVHQTLDLLRRLFPYLTCKRQITGRDERPCLYYHIKRCLGPCIGAVSKEEYRAMIKRICLFLEGKTEDIIAGLRQQMQDAAVQLQFEKAGELRDYIQAIEQVTERQKIVSTSAKDRDVIAFVRDNGLACAQVFFVRQGKLIGREYFLLTGTADENDQEILGSFLKQFYDEAAYIPPEIILPNVIEDSALIEEWLRARRDGSDVSLRVPRRGQLRELVQMAARNAAETLVHLRAQWEADETRHITALTELQEALELSAAPVRIEGYDISNIQGTAATGSMVVFVKGISRKSDYRRFRIRTVPGADDYAMMQEVLRRRFKRAADEREGDAVSEALPPGKKRDKSFSILPDLILIDGGKGQLNAALEVLQECGLDNLAVASLAKKREELFVPGQPDPVVLPRDSQGLYLVQRVRDEAHRFAVSYHRTVRRKKGLASQLEEVPGIGPKRRQALLEYFGSMEAIRQASVDELAAVPMMTRKAAEQVKESL
ncbi:MAG: excinuclease ABC subunit UvrC [Chloroflexota bacterium]|nr:excinuclease ABC subunit UvrC [Chloroflexota bacterium]